jgi:hypothetical protein
MDPFNGMSEQMIADYAAIDPVYADGISGVLNMGVNFASMYFRWMPTKGENGALMYEQSPCLVVVRPRASLLCGPGCAITAMLDSQPTPRAGGRQALLRAMQ